MIIDIDNYDNYDNMIIYDNLCYKYIMYDVNLVPS